MIERAVYAKRGDEKVAIAWGRPMVEADDLMVHLPRWWGKEGLRASAGRLCQKPLASTSSRRFELRDGNLGLMGKKLRLTPLK